MSSEERDLDELLGAYALDAVSDEERRAVENYLAINPKARAEVEEHREVATMLAWSGADAPDGLWERIADNLEGGAPPVPSGQLAEVLSYDSGRDRRQARRRSFATWAMASAAAAVVVVLAVSVLTQTDDAEDGVEGLAAAAETARLDSESSVTTIVDPEGGGAVEAIIDPNGHGFLLADELPELTSDRTYQLWGLIDDEAISLGVLGQNPELETFTVEGDVTALVITNEVAGGVATDGNPEGAWVGTF